LESKGKPFLTEDGGFRKISRVLPTAIKACMIDHTVSHGRLSGSGGDVALVQRHRRIKQRSTCMRRRLVTFIENVSCERSSRERGGRVGPGVPGVKRDRLLSRSTKPLEAALGAWTTIHWSQQGWIACCITKIRCL
jgi:hypothetical protein